VRYELLCATGRLDDELMAVTRRVSTVLRTLPKEVTPVNLEELRRVKQLLVELESKADLLRCGIRMQEPLDLRQGAAWTLSRPRKGIGPSQAERWHAGSAGRNFTLLQVVTC